MQYEHIVHTIEPVFDKNSKVLILGTFPSPKSRAGMFFYGHPQNRFWSVISAVFGEECPKTNSEKIAFLKRNQIAVWDTVYECDIMGASDSSIKNAVPTNLKKITNAANIRAVFTTGNTANRYYIKYHEKEIGIKAICLPSTSPANARWSKEALINEYKIIKQFI